jgi:peptidoglycan biosynthesis protein MviN/MurJ (putative lipid II flippase)
LLVTLVIPEVGIYGPTYGVLAGAACQVLVQLPGLLKQRFKYSSLSGKETPGFSHGEELPRAAALLAPPFLIPAISCSI